MGTDGEREEEDCSSSEYYHSIELSHLRFDPYPDVVTLDEQCKAAQMQSDKIEASQFPTIDEVLEV